jgi:hypothetical protein
MSQHDFDIANQTASNARVDINLALKALGSLSSGPVAPTTTYANMLWYDTLSNILKVRSEADDAWISIGYLHQGENQFHILDDTYVSDTSGNHVGLLGDQSTATWQAGTSTTESLISPAKLRASTRSFTELGTLSLTSGSSKTLSGIALANYRTLEIIITSVSVTSTTPLLLEGSSLFTVSTTPLNAYKKYDVDSGLEVGVVTAASGINISPTNTSLTISIATGTFVSGTVKFYGVN